MSQNQFSIKEILDFGFYHKTYGLTKKQPFANIKAGYEKIVLNQYIAIGCFNAYKRNFSKCFRNKMQNGEIQI